MREREIIGGRENGRNHRDNYREGETRTAERAKIQDILCIKDRKSL